MGRRGHQNWALEEKQDFILTEVEWKRDYIKEDYSRLRDWHQQGGGVKRCDVLGNSEKLAWIDIPQLVDTSW